MLFYLCGTMDVSVRLFTDFEKLGDPRVKNYVLMESPLQPIIIAALYMTFILKIGPIMMKHREPLNLKYVMIAYNIVQIVANFIVFIMFAKIVPNLNLLCSPAENSTSAMLVAHHCYTLLKFLDLLDTIFFVLRKRWRQVTYLHVHHHVGMLASAWISGKYFPGGHALYLGFYNTFVHTIMYGYYLMTVCWPEYGKSAWWKKYLTQVQIVQHYVVFFTFFVQLVNQDCSYPKFWTAVFLSTNILMIFLFTKFYRDNYGKTSKKIK
ncbi:elongation of very long chain fatty acids protein AAEL008004-like [Tribolium madens]|uniref:elongation of very long chain fatty acids protein AAEL008004-like n=1 Tax=Tribolium madens TaxID=41895 RepID=UPI001CF73651|nr:elongation of very long chain fatty acids protein AAEL008004-like [Tribolium madens]